MARQIERPPADAKLSVSSGGAVQASPSQAGLSVDMNRSRDQLNAALNGESQSVELVTSRVPAAIPDELIQTAHEQLDRLLAPDAEPLTVTFADQKWQLPHAETAKLVTLSGGTKPNQPAVVKIDEAPLRTWAGKVGKEIDQAVQDARFSFNGGNLKVLRPSRQGRSLDQDAMVSSVHAALLAGEHTVALPVAVVDPAVPSTDPQSLGITELIDRGTTSFAGSIAEKKHNIQLAAQRLNGVVVPPGGTFSFNDSVGPTTIDSGFQWGFGITSGDNGPKTVPSVAGGICQVATTLFQPVFWSGYQLEERYWHLYWIPAYTSRGVVGLDVTVDGDAGLDFKWTNPTKDYILVQSDADEQNIYFGLYGKKPPWKVQVDDAVITNRTPPDPKPLAQPEPTLPWGRTLTVETARDGFDRPTRASTMRFSTCWTPRSRQRPNPARRRALVRPRRSPRRRLSPRPQPYRTQSRRRRHPRRTKRHNHSRSRRPNRPWPPPTTAPVSRPRQRQRARPPRGPPSEREVQWQSQCRPQTG